VWRERRRRRRRLVLVLDVSGSMAAYSRGLAAFAHAALRADRRWEAFCFGTRLTRITAQLAGADADEALRRAAAEVVDWDGGTRIADSLKRFLDDFGHGGLARGAVVVICSDGLEIGEPELLAEQMARLARLAHRVIWLNPLKESPDYEPLARGMRAALPFVDVFASGHSFEAVAAALGGSPYVGRSGIRPSP
ncbi:MAG: VWA domain-containing protein, partial [Gaiellaceae bacterium]